MRDADFWVTGDDQPNYDARLGHVRSHVRKVGRAFSGAGLTLPNIVDTQKVAASHHWALTTDPRFETVQAYMMLPGLFENVDKRPSLDMYSYFGDFELIAHEGHGVNSYGLNHFVQKYGVSAFTQILYGGMYTDNVESKRRWNKAMSIVEATFAEIGDLPEVQSGVDVLVEFSDFRSIAKLSVRPNFAGLFANPDEANRRLASPNLAMPIWQNVLELDLWANDICWHSISPNTFTDEMELPIQSCNKPKLMEIPEVEIAVEMLFELAKITCRCQQISS